VRPGTSPAAFLCKKITISKKQAANQPFFNTKRTKIPRICGVSSLLGKSLAVLRQSEKTRTQAFEIVPQKPKLHPKEGFQPITQEK